MTSLQNVANADGVWAPNGKYSTGADMELQVQFSKNSSGDVGGDRETCHRRERENSHTRLKPNEGSESSASAGSDRSIGGGGGRVRTLPAEPAKTIFCFLLMMFVFACNLLFTGTIHDRTPTVQNQGPRLQKPLRDISLDASVQLGVDVKYRYTLLTISEILLVCTTAFATFVLCFHPHRSIVFRRSFFLVTLLFAVRLISMNVTMLPISSATLFQQCDAKSGGGAIDGGALASRFVELATSCGLANVKYCGNYVYSGHTVVFVLNCLLVGEYCPAWIINLPLKLCAVCGIALILMSEYDYTISIITAYYITTRLFWVYHTLAHNPSLKNVREFGVNQICKEWWYPLFRFLEGNVKAVVPPMRRPPIFR
jgi:shingomyelin synthase